MSLTNSKARKGFVVSEWTLSQGTVCGVFFFFFFSDIQDFFSSQKNDTLIYSYICCHVWSVSHLFSILYFSLKTTGGLNIQLLLPL